MPREQRSVPVPWGHASRPARTDTRCLTYAQILDGLVNIHVAPSFTVNPHNSDVYSAYNKPEAVIDWMAKNDVKEDYVLILDAGKAHRRRKGPERCAMEGGRPTLIYLLLVTDMVLRAPITPAEFGATKGKPVSAPYTYLKGVNNALAMKWVPEVPPSNDHEAGPYGRRGEGADRSRLDPSPAATPRPRHGPLLAARTS